MNSAPAQTPPVAGRSFEGAAPELGARPRLAVLGALALILLLACPADRSDARAASGLDLSGAFSFLGDEGARRLAGEVQARLLFGAQGPRLATRIASLRVEYHGFEGLLDGEALLSPADGGGWRAENLALRLREPALPMRGDIRRLDALNLELTARELLIGPDGGLILNGLDLRGPGLRLFGDLARAKDGSVRGRLAGRADDLEVLVDALSPLVPGLGIRASGRAAISLDAEGPDGSGPRLTLRPENATIAMQSGRPWEITLRNLHGKVDARLEGPFPSRSRGDHGAVDPSDESEPWSWRASADLRGDLALPGRDVAARKTRLRAELDSETQGVRLSGLELLLPEDHFAAGGHPLPATRITGGGILATGNEASRLELSLRLAEAGSIETTLSGPTGKRRLQARVRELSVAALAPLFDALGPLPDSSSGQSVDTEAEETLPGKGLADFSPTGRLDARLDLTEESDRLPRGDVRISLREAGFMSPQGDLLGDGIRLGMDLELLRDPADGFRARLDVDRGEVLAGTVYMNHAAHPFHLMASGRIERAPGSEALRGLDLRSTLEGFGRILARGDLLLGSPPSYQGTLSLEDLRLEPIFSTFVREPLSLSRPFLAETTVTGSASLEADVSGQGRRAEMRGRLDLSGLDLDSPAVKVAGLDLRLPLAYVLGRDPASFDGPGHAPAPDSPEGWGVLRAERLILPLGEIRVEDMALALVPNRLYVDGELNLPVMNGTVRLADISVDEPLSAAFTAALRVLVRDLDLGTLAPGGIAMEGTLGGELPRVVFTKQRLRASGRLTGTFFGGSLEVDDIAAEQPLASSRTVLSDLRVRLLDLERLSRATGIGQVTGRLDVDVSGLAVAFGQPVAFSMRARTSDTDASKTISLKAVNSLTVLGTGAGIGDVGVGLFAQIFQEFSYDRIGIYSKLVNDMFTIRGLIRDAGIEYLIKKPYLFGINVINSNPENRISFSDMLERLKRVVSPRESAGDDRPNKE